ncbi:MAG: tetratricopeptide repeat protein, partial [Flavobacteriales bacterium]|nr:tetratricopeptide repeat protein [Flavobacteriales bacterium]
LNEQIDSLSSINLKKKIPAKERVFFLKAQSRALTNLGIVNKEKANYDRALDHFLKSLKVRKELGNKRDIAASLNSIGIIYYYKGDFANSIKFYSKSLKYRELIGDKKGISQSLSNIGMIYRLQEDYENEIKYYLRSLEIKKEIEDQDGLAHCYNNIGNNFRNRRKYQEALDYYFKSLKIRRELGNKKDIASVLANIGTIHYDLDDFEKAIDYYTQSMNIQQEIGARKNISGTLSNLGSIFIDQGKYSKALDYCARSLEIAQEIGFNENIQIASELLWKTHKLLGNHKEALLMHELFIQTRDSLKSLKNQKAIIHSEYKYKYEKEAFSDSIKHQEAQKRIQLALDKERAEVSNARLIAIVGLVLALGTGSIIVLLINRKRVRQKHHAKVDKLRLEQRLLLTQMNPHFMFNALNSISAFISKNNTKEAKYFLAKFAKIMRQILDASRKQTITLEDELQILENYVHLECLRSGKRFDYNFNVASNLKESLQNFTIPPMLLQPFIENAIKHGLDNADSRGLLQVNLKEQNDNYLCIEILDNGIGIKKAQAIKEKLNITHKSAAMDITNERLAGYNQSNQLPIEIKIEDLESPGTSGTKVEVLVPIAA